jgi:hypothetical protein
MRLTDFESRRVDELAPATLASYKTKAGAAATAADAAGDRKTADRRFSGIVKATKKQFDQDAKGMSEGLDDTVRFEIDSENAYNHVMDQFGSVIDWDGDTMVAPRKYWGAIQELALAASGEASEEHGLAENYPKHQDLSGISTDKLKAYVAKYTSHPMSGEGAQVRRVRAELQRRAEPDFGTKDDEEENQWWIDYDMKEGMAEGKLKINYDSWLSKVPNTINDKMKKVLRVMQDGKVRSRADMLRAAGIDPNPRSPGGVAGMEGTDYYLYKKGLLDVVDIVKGQKYFKISKNASQGIADGSVNYTLGHTPDAEYVYSIYRDGKKEGTYHSVDQAREIMGNMKLTSPNREYKIKRGARNKMAGPASQLPEQGMTEDDDAVAAFLARGGEIQQLKPQSGPKRSGVAFASKHIGSAGGRGNTKGKVSGLGANTGKASKPVVTAEQHMAEDALSGMKKLAGIAPAQTPPTPGQRQYRHMPTAVQPR